jgi:hypothetical protein
MPNQDIINQLRGPSMGQGNPNGSPMPQQGLQGPPGASNDQESSMNQFLVSLPLEIKQAIIVRFEEFSRTSRTSSRWNGSDDVKVFYIVYNDMPLIKDSVESVLKQGVEIIAVDGRFRDFPSKGSFSTDGTYEYLEEIGAKIIGVPNLTEVEKRNLLFSMTSVGDTVLVLDADECVHGTIPELKADIGIVALLEDSHGVRATFTLHNRFFNVESGLKYEKLHHRIVDSSGSLFCSADECGANSVRL